jgi:hypothetical protein
MTDEQPQSEVTQHCSQYQSLELRQACIEGSKAMKRIIQKKIEETEK